MKKLIGSVGAGLLIALAAALFLNRRYGIFGESRRQAETANKVLRDAEQLADNMRDEFVPGKVNTGELSPGLVDLNACSLQDLLSIRGLDPESATRIVESRPYRSKMDLLSRMVIPSDVFTMINSRISIGKPDESVKIA
jgi:DNA uptake protein ComE-like DNA-binding protein